MKQVLSRSGDVVGSSELLVSSDRVNIDRLRVDVISGLSISPLEVATVGDDRSASRVIVANVTLHRRLTRKYQVCF